MLFQRVKQPALGCQCCIGRPPGRKGVNSLFLSSMHAHKELLSTNIPIAFSSQEVVPKKIYAIRVINRLNSHSNKHTMHRFKTPQHTRFLNKIHTKSSNSKGAAVITDIMSMDSNGVAKRRKLHNSNQEGAPEPEQKGNPLQLSVDHAHSIGKANICVVEVE